MTSFDWSSLEAVRGARTDAVPEMITHALVVLADLLEQPNHACEFSLDSGPLIDNDVAESVNVLLPTSCHVQRLDQEPCWRIPVSDALPALFVPTGQPDAWTEGAPARTLVETLTKWSMALMSRLWPDDAQCWTLTVETQDWYAAAYIDVVINHQEQVWLLHLGVTD
jgi:hypothetical protein